MVDDTRGERRRALEEAFFHIQDRELLEDFRDHIKAMERRAQLSEASGIHDENVLNRLVALNFSPSTLAAMSLVPLVEVAWASGKIPASEHDALLAAVQQLGVTKEDEAYLLFEEWLEDRPSPELLAVWKDFIVILRDQMSAEEYDQLKHDLLDRAVAVARAAGGILGIGQICKEEQQMLDELSAAFG